MTTTTKQLTFEEYLNYHDDTDKRYELVDGELLEIPSARGKHADITVALNDIFKAEIKRLGSSLDIGVEINYALPKTLD